MKLATDTATNNDRKKVLTRNLIKPKRFPIPTKLISIDRFMKQYREFIVSSCGTEEGAYAKYLRPFLDGHAADWYDANVDGDMAEDFDAITDNLKKRFERESYISSSFIPLQEDIGKFSGLSKSSYVFIVTLYMTIKKKKKKR